MSITVTEKKPKTTPMRWLKLGEAKDPDFKKGCFLFKVGEHGEYFTTGHLRRKAEEDDSKVEYFFHDDKTGETDKEFSHYCIITAPTE